MSNTLNYYMMSIPGPMILPDQGKPGSADQLHNAISEDPQKYSGIIKAATFDTGDEGNAGDIGDEGDEEIT